MMQSNDVEQLLWKSVHYRPIEEFRNRLRVASQAVQQQQQQYRPGGAAGPSALDAAGGDAALQQQKLLAAYIKFLGESVGFYQRLVWKLQWVWGGVGAPVQLDLSAQVSGLAVAAGGQALGFGDVQWGGVGEGIWQLLA